MKEKSYLEKADKAALKVAIIYLVFSIPWILFSDQIVLFFFRNSYDLTRIQTIKGWGFILITAGLIFYLLKKEIENHMQTRKDFEESEEKYRLVIDNTPDLLYRTDTNGVINFISPSVYAISGYTVEQALGMNMAQEVYVYPEERERALTILAREGKIKNFEAQLKRKDGSIFWASTNAHFLKDLNGNIQGVEGITRDITEKKLAEQALSSSEQRLRAILEATPDPMVVYDMKGHPQYLNPAFTKVFGWTLEELKEQIIPFVPEDQKQITKEKIKEIYQDGTPLTFETRRYTKTRDILDIILSAAVSKDTDGKPFGMVVNLKDISAKKVLEAQFEQAQKMESLGTLAGGIAHDFNNLLTGIFGYMDLARKHTKEVKVIDYLTRAIHSSDRARDLTHQLLTFSKGGAPVKQTGALIPFLEDMTRFALSGADVSCSFDLPEDLWTCEYDKNQLGQVIDNIVINAHHAMPSGGNVHVAAKNMEFYGKENSVLNAGQYIKISISDTGTGIPDKYLKRIFDPFFSTKQTGSGLGLATSYSIVKRHGGIIDVESEPGIGSVFHIFLPATGRATVMQEKRIDGNYHGSGKILIMDDEELIREMLEAMLASMGFSCVCTSNGNMAVTAFKDAVEKNEPFSAVILDLTIPGGMGGKQTVQELRQMDQSIPVFVASGYSEDVAVANPEAFGFTASIEKPFTMSELAAVFKTYL